MQNWSKTTLGASGIGLLLLGLLGGLLWANSLSKTEIPGHQPSTNIAPKTVVIAGDIACESDEQKTTFGCRQEDTAALVSSLKPDAVLTAGDNQYPAGTLTSYQDSYDKSWGMFKNITYPVPGNHEYYTPDGSGYFDYFKERAGERGKGYYGFTVGDWRFIALNSEIDVSENSAQLTWLKQELEANKNACTLAYWHKPRFSTGGHASDPNFDPLWRVLYANNVDVVVNGHSHAYERFAPQNPDGQYVATKGITQFVSGMGGRAPEGLKDLIPPLVTRQNHAFGVLKFTLLSKAVNFELSLLILLKLTPTAAQSPVTS